MDSSGSPTNPTGSPQVFKDKDKDSSYESVNSQSLPAQLPTGIQEPLKEDDVELVPDNPVKHLTKREQ